MKKKSLALPLALVMCLSIVLSSLLIVSGSAAGFTRTRTYNGQFVDVSPTNWFYQSVKDCYELGLMNGTNDAGTTFSPNAMFTVIEAMTIAARLHNIYHNNTLDLPTTSSDWIQNTVNYCIKNGLTVDGQFDSYMRYATRAEMISLFASALPDSQWNAINNVNELPDVSASTDGYSAIFKLYNAGILEGSDEYGTCQPYAQITRMEVAAIAARCADVSLRKTVNLTPLSQREAPEIQGSLYYSYYKMSSGRMRFQDSTTKLYGYLDTAGAVKIAAQYTQATDFVNGYAWVNLNNKWGVIDTYGNAVIPMNYYSYTSLGSGAYYARTSSSTKYAVIINGKVASNHIYDSVSSNGLYVTARNGNNWDIYDMNGTKCSTMSVDNIYMATNSPLLAVKEGNKYALATAYRVITEPIYDGIDLHNNSTLARLRYGSQYGLGGLNGEIIAPGEYNGYNFSNSTNDYRFSGDYALAYDGRSYAIADANGIVSEFATTNTTYYVVETDRYLLACYSGSSSSWTMVHDRLTGTTYNQGQVSGSPVAGYALLPDNTFVLVDGTICTDLNNIASKYFTFKTTDGKYGLLHNGGVASEGIYDTEEEAIAAYRFYKQTTEGGKPVVVVGNDVAGFEPVIRYYKNSLYYDEIREIGEGYYACKYNVTWYLLHA